MKGAAHANRLVAAKAAAAASTAKAKASSSAAARADAQHRADDRKGAHRGVAIRLGAADGRRLRATPPPRQNQRRIAALRTASAAQMDEWSRDDAFMPRPVDQQESMQVQAAAGSRSMGDSSREQRDSDGGGGSRHQGERASKALQAHRAWQRHSGAEQDADVAAAFCQSLFGAARAPSGDGAQAATAKGPSRHQLLAQLAAHYRRYAENPPGGGLRAVQRQLVSMAAAAPPAQPGSEFESTLNCLMPLLLLNLQRARPASLLGLAAAKAAVLSGANSAPAIVAPPASTWAVAT